MQWAIGEGRVGQSSHDNSGSYRECPYGPYFSITCREPLQTPHQLDGQTNTHGLTTLVPPQVV